LVAAACDIAERLSAALIVVETHSGRTATALSNQRGQTLILALGHEKSTISAMSLLWGVVPQPMPRVASRAELRDYVLEWGRARGLIASGARIILIRGSNPADPTHNELEVYEVP
jgi:pyruvate kinase